MTTPQTIADHYIATWNETDPDRRLALLKSGWTAAATYVDPVAGVAGVEQINGLIGGAQAQFPGFRFVLKGAPDGHGDHVRLAWSLGPDGAPAPIEGSDVIVTDGGRIAQVIGFLDKLPQTA